MKQVAIVGLPNVGKTLLFNILTEGSATTSPYPFSTKSKNTGLCFVKDERLLEISKYIQTNKIIFPSFEVVDVAGLVKGASKGEGLGNEFLSYILPADLILEVVRAFEDETVAHMGSKVDEDIEIIKTELILKDIEFIERRLESTQKKLRFSKNAEKEYQILKELRDFLEKGNLASEFEYIDQVDLQLLTKKKIIFLININQTGEKNLCYLKEKLKEGEYFVIDLLFESEILNLSLQEQQEFASEVRLDELKKFIYQNLSVLTFYTKERGNLQGWSIDKDTTAYQAAGLIHSDIQRGFVVAEVIKYQDFERLKDFSKIKETGLVHQTGRDYIIEDGDIISFKFSKATRGVSEPS